MCYLYLFYYIPLFKRMFYGLFFHNTFSSSFLLLIMFVNNCLNIVLTYSQSFADVSMYSEFPNGGSIEYLLLLYFYIIFLYLSIVLFKKFLAESSSTTLSLIRSVLFPTSISSMFSSTLSSILGNQTFLMLSKEF